MPLFPIEAHLSSESTATLDQLPEKIRSDAPASTSKEGEWSRVGQSYSHRADHTHQNHGSQSQDAPGTSSRGTSVQSRIQPPIAPRRRKAADFFEEAEAPTSHVDDSDMIDALPGHNEKGSHSGHDDRTKEVEIIPQHREESTRRKRRERSPSLSDTDRDSRTHTSARRPETGGKERDRSRERTSKSFRKSKRSRRHRNSSRRHKSRRGHEDGRSEDSADEAQRIINSSLSTGKEMFVEDRQGDQDTLSFGGFYRLDRAIYQVMNDAAQHGRGRNVRRRKLVRYFGGDARKANGDGHLARMQLWKGDKRKDQARSWPRSDRLAKISTGEDGDASTDRQEGRQRSPRRSTDFLPVDPGGPADESTVRISDDTGTQGTEDGVFTESLEQRIARRTKEFNLMTRRRPESVDVWMHFADFQDEAVQALHVGGSALQSRSATMARTILDKRASVLDGALRCNPASIRLVLARLDVASQLQEHDAVDSLWKTAIEKNNHSCSLWLRYFQFKAGHFASFSVPHQRSIYAHCVQAVKSKRDETHRLKEQERRAKGIFVMRGTSMLDDNKECALVEKDLLDVLWSYCMMEKAAGYEERAVGALQAMVELNVRRGGTTVSLDGLESFWDSEYPRIGDAHPSEAGISRWQRATKAQMEEGKGPVTVGVRDATTRTRPLGGGPGARGKRKRAVDFFRQSSSTESTGSRTAEAGGRSNLRTGIRDKFDGATGVDVLEEAYRSALALSTVPMPPAYNDPAQAGNDPKTMSSVQSERRDAAQNAPNDISQASSSDSDFSREESSTKTDPSESEPSKKIEVSRCAKPRAEEHSSTASSDPAWVGNRAVDAEGLIWVDEAQTTAYSVRHGYRIDVQGAQDSVSGLEYGRILKQMRGAGSATEDHGRDVEASTAASKRLRNRGAREQEAEAAAQAAALEDVPEGDVFASWAKAEDGATLKQWQPLRSTTDGDGADEQPDRVVLVEDLRPFLFKLSQPASLRTLVSLLLSIGGVYFPRSQVSHSSRSLLAGCCAGTFGDAGLSSGLLSAVSGGLQAVWSASGSDLPAAGRGVVGCAGCPESYLSSLAVSSAADQFMLLTDEAVRDMSRHSFLRNVLHHLIRTPEALPVADARPASTSAFHAWGVHGEDALVQLQCTLILFEGHLASAAGARYGGSGASGNGAGRTMETWSDAGSHGHEARKVAKSLLEASQASATDLRLWSSYVQLLALLGNRQEAIKVAEKALSMVQALPDDKKSLSVELFWLTFRLHAGLPLSPRDAHSSLENTPGRNETISLLFEPDENRNGNREMALLVLCSFAEGSFKRSKMKKPKRKGVGATSRADGVTPPRLMAARRLMANQISQRAAELHGVQEDESHQPGGAFDLTPPFMYHAVAWVWLEYLTRGQDKAEAAMAECLRLARSAGVPLHVGANDELSSETNREEHIGRTLMGNKPYSWDVVPESNVLGVCLERMHRAFSELLMVAQRHDRVKIGPRQVRAVLLRGLRSFPGEPGMLCMLLHVERFSGSQQRLVHHLSEVSRRRTPILEQGPTSIEWVFSVTHQVVRCVYEARQFAVSSGGDPERGKAAIRNRKEEDKALVVKNWLPGSYGRLKRSMEEAVTHPTGRGIPLLWRLYMSLEAMRGNNIQAKQLFWRAVHACPGTKAVWMDALRGEERSQVGMNGLRPAFRAKELGGILDALVEKSLHLRAEPPS